MQAITPFLWFDTQAEEAAERYVSVFAKLGRPGETRVRGVTRYGEAGPGTPGSAMTVQFVLDGQEFNRADGAAERPRPGALGARHAGDAADEEDRHRGAAARCRGPPWVVTADVGEGHAG